MTMQDNSERRPKPQSPAPIDETSLRYEGWRVVAVCFLMATFAWAFAFYGQTVYVAEFRAAYGWPSSLISIATSAFFLFGALLVAFFSDAMRAVGLRACLLGGLACMAVAAAAIGFVSSPLQLYITYAVLAFGWAGMSLGAVTNTLGQWFSARRGLAISLALNGASIGGVIGVPAMVIAVQAYGFATTMLAASILMVVIMLPAILFGIGQPPRREQADAATPMLSSGAIRGRALRSLNFWTIAAPFALVQFAQVSFIVHQISFMDPLIGRERAAAAVAILTLTAFLGRVGLGFFIDRLDQRKVSAALFVSQAAALVLMINFQSDIALLAGSALFGITVGNAITLPALIVQREFDARWFGVLVSLVTAINQVTYAFGPGLIGVLRDWTGSYGPAFYLVAVLQIVAAGIVLIRARAT